MAMIFTFSSCHEFVAVFGQLYLDRGISAIAPFPKTADKVEKRKHERYLIHNADADLMFNMIADLGKHIGSYTEYI